MTMLNDAPDGTIRPEVGEPMPEGAARRAGTKMLTLLADHPALRAEVKPLLTQWANDPSLRRAVIGRPVPGHAFAAVIVFPCEASDPAGCPRTAKTHVDALIADLTADTGVEAEGATFERHQLIVEAVGGEHMLDPSRSYHRPLPEDLRRWYHYTPNGGHSLLIALASGYAPDVDPGHFLVSAPVKAVQRAGWTVTPEQYLLVDLPYSAEIGLMTEPDDDEY